MKKSMTFGKSNLEKSSKRIDNIIHKMHSSSSGFLLVDKNN